jgi:Asp-tRNA(Asn)/Glu-tRNA(Gln) amidotransferase A subunit family amidase
VGKGLWQTAAVPSHLYNIPNENKPLAGKRITIKDNFKLSNIQTTQSNRAFVKLYGPEAETANILEALLNLGAILVGKTKMCAFASAEEATDQ